MNLMVHIEHSNAKAREGKKCVRTAVRGMDGHNIATHMKNKLCCS